MALSKSSLKSRIENEIKDVFGEPEDSEVLSDFCQGLANAIVDEIQQNARVNVGITVNIPNTSNPGQPSSGVTSGTGTIS